MGAILAGHYYVVKPLGSGGFGQTFLARDNHLPGQPLCVVKQFKPRLTSSTSLEVAKRLFDLEAKTLYRLGNHDQIPRLLAHFEQDGEFYLVQDYIEGWSLEQELARRKRLSEAEVVVLLRDVLHALTFVHAQNVIHRDIKPSNLIRRKHDRRMVLIDFGAVKQVSAQQAASSGQTSFTVAIGSPGYMPVEQQSSLPQFSSDIYAVGMVALQALTGISPKNLPRDSRGENSCALLGVSSKLGTVLDQMVRYDYRERYQTAADVLKALDSLQHLSASVDHPDSITAIFNHAASTLIQPPNPSTHDQDETLPPNVVPRLIRSLPQVSRSPVSTRRDRQVDSNAPTISGPAIGYPLSGQPDVQVVSRQPVSGQPLSRQEYRNRQALLTKVRHYWIHGVLEASLHDQMLMVLGLEHRPDAVTSPWNVALQTQQRPEQTLPPGTPILSIFDQLGTGRTLLILGDPGAGKTTTLLQLAQELIERAEQDVEQLIPVVLNLASWSETNHHFADWIIEELNKKYQVPTKISHPWIEQQQLLLMLDGLDEVRSEYREGCVAALNQFQQQYSTEIVVCSRAKDYEALSNRLNFQSAIYLRSLTPAQINQYLNSLSTDLTGLHTLLNEDPALQELARSPLLLNIMVLAYQGIAAEDLNELLLVEERRRQLFNAYVERMLRRRSGDCYLDTQIITWLSWLAKRLIQHSQSVFLIEQIQPTWLQTKAQQRTYQVGVVLMGVLMGVIFGCITGGLTNGIMQGWYSGLLKALMNSLVFGFGFGLLAAVSKPEIETVETLRWSWKEARKNLVIGLKNGLMLCLIVGLMFGIISEIFPSLTPAAISRFPHSGLLLGLVGGVTGGVTGGIIFGLTRGLRGSLIETKTIPNQGIRRTLLSAGIGGLIGGATSFVIISIVYGALLGWQFGWLYGASYGFFGGFIAGFIFSGGQACFKHLMLRLVLWRSGYLPWNYSRFLNHVANRVFLQKVGGGYIFLHRLLLEHFAQMR
ncbi:MAG: hypothetical protein Kow00121_53410 [Elainellaceae cyanobacterium]